MHGPGLLRFPNETFYKGEFVNDERCGKGMLLQNDGFKYEGSWEDDLPHGVGELEWEFKAMKYTGEFKHGMMNGRGKLEL